VCGVGTDVRAFRGAPAGVKEDAQAAIARIPKLLQNYPNPFNPSTRIGFQIADRGRVSLKVFDMLGREVATLIDEEKQPGEYEVRWDAGDNASGVYLYRLAAGGSQQIRRLILVK
jgi:hypothetical protein